MKKTDRIKENRKVTRMLVMTRMLKKSKKSLLNKVYFVNHIGQFGKLDFKIIDLTGPKINFFLFCYTSSCLTHCTRPREQ